MRIVLNDPDFYADAIFQFFNSHPLFQLFPYVAYFRDLNKHLFIRATQSQSMRQFSSPKNSKSPLIGNSPIQQ